MSLSLIDFVRSLADDMVVTPIYRKGAVMRSGRAATGKNPHEDGHDRNLNKHDAAHLIEKSPKSLKAIGIWTGVRGNGYLILDVDKNHSALKRKWGESLQGAPVITSTRKNAAKYLLRAPEELWGDLSGWGHSDEHAMGYEVLWGRQGLIYGDYPGSSDGKAPEGEYGWHGDPESVPLAPEWLLAEMRAAKASEKKGGFIKSKRALDLADRTEDEIAQIVQECLSVIPHKGAGSNSEWVKIGMAIHSVLPGDLGLTLWSAWSSEDPEFADEWAKGNPCTERWQSFKPGGINLGSLIWLADQVDPKRARFSVASKSIVEAAETDRVQQYREVTLPFEEIIRRGMAIYEQDDVARMNYELHSLAMEARYRDQSQLEKLLLDHITQQNQEASFSMDNSRRDKREFLIPGLLPYSYLLLMYGAPGCGKSATALALMKHVVDGVPFQLKNQRVPIKRGPVIYFNADMSSADFCEEYDLHEIKNGKDFHFVPDFNLYRQAQFVKRMNKIKPSMICIDSLSSCSGAKAGDENKAEFAQPLYWLSAKNGILWPACTIVVLHHAAKATGGARGSTAIAAAVSEVWNITHPKKDSGLSVDQRVISIGKSRLNRSGESLLQTQNDDLTVSLVEAKRSEELQTKAGSVADKIMVRLQTRGDWMSRDDLNSDPLVGGSVAAIRKSLQRLENRGVLEVVTKPSPQGKPIKLYRALRESPRGEIIEMGQVPLNPVEDWKAKWDNTPSEESCPIKDSSPGAPSADVGTLSPSPRARTEEEIDSVIDPKQWD